MSEARYLVNCHNCRGEFDALAAAWCSCLVTERTLVCPNCLTCFCKAPPAHKQKFWSGAPKELWDRKFEEHQGTFQPGVNPEPDVAPRPLVLLVDDEPDIQRTASRVIQSLGFGMVLARNGAEGLEMARRYKPDLVLSDALMPKMDGRDMCREIKNDPETKSVKVVVMTALYTSVKHENEAFKRYGVDGYLKKPLDFTQLRTVLQKYLG